MGQEVQDILYTFDLHSAGQKHSDTMEQNKRTSKALTPSRRTAGSPQASSTSAMIMLCSTKKRYGDKGGILAESQSSPVKGWLVRL